MFDRFRLKSTDFYELNEMASRRTNFGERSESAPDRGGKSQSAGGGGRHKVTFRHCLLHRYGVAQGYRLVKEVAYRGKDFTKFRCFSTYLNIKLISGIRNSLEISDEVVNRI